MSDRVTQNKCYLIINVALSDFDLNILKVPKREIFDRSDFPDFYIIKSLCGGDFGAKIKNFFTNN